MGSELVDSWSDWVATNSEGGVTEVERGDGVAEWLELESSGVIVIELYCCNCAIRIHPRLVSKGYFSGLFKFLKKGGELVHLETEMYRRSYSSRSQASLGW